MPSLLLGMGMTSRTTGAFSSLSLRDQMPRIRTIKPEMFQDEKLAPLAPIDRLVYIGLIAMADDAGRLLDSIKVIDAFVFPDEDSPYTSRDSIETLARLSRVIRYTAESGQKCIQIVRWEKHQRVDKPSKYVLPAPTPEDVAASEDRNTREAGARQSRESRETVAKDSRYDLDLRPTTLTNDHTPPPAQNGSAYDRFIASLPAKSRTAWKAKMRAWCDGMDLAAGLAALPQDIESALSDWEANGAGDANADWIRRHVVRAVRSRLAAEAAQQTDTPTPGFTRHNGKMSGAERGYLDAKSVAEAMSK
jgi:hypothetical protein